MSPDSQSKAKTISTISTLFLASIMITATIPWYFDSNPAEALSSLTSDSVHSDFNGDGFEDLAIGTPFETPIDTTPGGSVNVIYGSAAGLQTSSPAAQFWHQESPGIHDELDGVDSGDNFGASLAAADFNNDGFGDLAIGVSGESVGTIERTGAVHVLYGSSSGLQTSSPISQFWHQNSPGIINESEQNDAFGWSLAAGDFNADDYADLAIGVIGESIGTVQGAGAVHILHGSASGLRSSASGSTPDDQFWHQGKPGIEDIEELNDVFGWTLAVGDFNGDGKDDLAIGTLEDLGDIENAGTVHVLYGSSSGLQATSPADQLWHQNKPGVENAAEPYEQFGSSMAAGDFNNDGKDDLAIGVKFESIGTAESAGAVNVLYGSNSGLQTSSPADQFWHQGKPGVEETEQHGDRFGESLAAGDFNKDGKDDLAIGVPGEDVWSGRGAQGAVHVLYGSAVGLRTTSPADQLWHQNKPGIADSPEVGDQFGSPLSAHDFNDDGYVDLAVSALGEDLASNNGRSGVGVVHVLYGSSTGLQTISPAAQYWHQDLPEIEDTAEDYGEWSDEFGTALS